MKDRDSVSWNTIITAYRRHGHPHEAIRLLHRMQQIDIQPDKFTFASVLPAFAKIGALEQGMDIHQSIRDRGFLSDARVASAQLDMYAKCRSIDKAGQLFDKMLERDVFSWTAMIAGYAQNGFAEKALETFKQMQLVGVKPNSTTFVSILTARSKLGALERGMAIHQRIKERGVSSDVIVATALVDMYAKCGSIDKVRELFDRMSQRDVILWNAMIAGYAQNGFVDEALETFEKMQLAAVKPNTTTFASILPVCAKMGALEQGYLSEAIVTTALVDMYAKHGSMNKACELFERMSQKDVISFHAMITGCAQNGLVEEALGTFKRMQLASVKPDSTSFASILPACSKMGALEQGMDVHQSIMEGGFLSDVVVGNALVDMYAKCGSTDKAREFFDRVPQRNVVSWTTMIAGYAQSGFVEKALQTFKHM